MSLSYFQARFGFLMVFLMPLLGYLHWRVLRYVQRLPIGARERPLRWLNRASGIGGIAMLVYLFRWSVFFVL